MVSDLVAIDNGPIDLPLSPDFQKYLDSMANIEQQKVRTHIEADQILRDYESVIIACFYCT